MQALAPKYARVTTMVLVCAQVRAAVHAFLNATLRYLHTRYGVPSSTKLLIVSTWSTLQSRLDDEFLMTSTVFEALKGIIADYSAGVRRPSPHHCSLKPNLF